MSEQEERSERAFTKELVAATRDIRCEGCRWEIIRTGGVVGKCIECKDYSRR